MNKAKSLSQNAFSLQKAEKSSLSFLLARSKKPLYAFAIKQLLLNTKDPAAVPLRY